MQPGSPRQQALQAPSGEIDIVVFDKSGHGFSMVPSSPKKAREEAIKNLWYPLDEELGATNQNRDE